MAKGGRRTYVRDNRGRFASTGATARGGRLKTAAGNKRKTVTTRMEGGKAAGTIGKVAKPKQAKSKAPFVSRAEPLTSGKGTLPSRSSLARSKKNLATNPTPSQRGAVTRANRYAVQARSKYIGAKGIEPGPGQMRKRQAFERPGLWDTKGSTSSAKTSRSGKTAKIKKQTSGTVKGSVTFAAIKKASAKSMTKLKNGRYQISLLGRDRNNRREKKTRVFSAASARRLYSRTPYRSVL